MEPTAELRASIKPVFPIHPPREPYRQNEEPNEFINQKEEIYSSFCAALHFPEQPQRQAVNQVARTSRGVRRVNETKKGSFACEHCGQTFAKSFQLGGHVSRAHPDKATGYKLKLETRKRREPLRLSLAWAKEQCKGMPVNAEYRKRIKALRLGYLSRYNL